MKVHIIFLITIFVLCFAFTSFGQTDSTERLDLEGKSALSFQVGSYLSLSSFDGSLLSIKKMIDNEHAWRAGIGLNGNHLEGEDYHSSDYSIYQDDYSELGLYLSFSKLSYLNGEHSLRGYYGLGGRIEYKHFWRSSESAYSNESIKFGPVAYFGVEWFVNKQISLSGEYGGYLYFSYSVNKTYVVSQEREIVTRDRKFGFSNDGAKIGLSVYF